MVGLSLFRPPLHVKEIIISPLMAREISIDEVLALLRSNHSAGKTPCTIRAVRSTGKRRGQIMVMQVRYGAPRKRGEVEPSLRSSTATFQHVDKATIPLTDLRPGKPPRYVSPLISHIIGYNNYRVRH